MPETTSLLKGDGAGGISDVSGGTEGQVLTRTTDGQEWADAGSDVFWATYGETTYAEIEAAHNAGKLVYLNKNNVVFRLSTLLASSEFVFFESIQPGTADEDMNNTGRAIARGIIFSPAGWTGIVIQRFSPALHASQHKTGGIDALAPADIGAAAAPTLRQITLTAAGWNSSTKQQTVTCSGVLADAAAQEIHVAPADASYDSAWNSCGVLCVAQGANSLTFQCDTIPTANITVYVSIHAL